MEINRESRRMIIDVGRWISQIWLQIQTCSTMKNLSTKTTPCLLLIILFWSFLVSKPKPDNAYSLMKPVRASDVRLLRNGELNIKYPQCDHSYAKVFKNLKNQVARKLASEHREINASTERDMLPIRKRFRDPPGPKTALLSFPGSGNTWTRHLLESLTGMYT